MPIDRPYRHGKEGGAMAQTKKPEEELSNPDRGGYYPMFVSRRESASVRLLA